MGLASGQARLLTLTARKADCEYNISINAMEKMSLAREQTDLSRQYYSKLQSKQISYYANGEYNKMNYQYLMGYGIDYSAVLDGNKPLKSENKMILTDYTGRVVLGNSYANAITKVIGSSCMDVNGRGSTFSSDKIPAIIAALLPGYSEEDLKAVIDNKKIEETYNATSVNTMSGETTGSKVVDNTEKNTSNIQKIIDFYYPIFVAAAANGWTTEYNVDMQTNDNYISDALVSGSLQLANVNVDGNYEPDTSLTYFVTSGLVQSRTDSSVREEITAWDNAEKESISEKESWLDLDIQNLSTELESINTEIQSVQSLIDDNINDVFDWGSS